MNQPRPGQTPDAAWQIQTLADSAQRLAERGEKDQAEVIYRQILEAAPYHVRALNFLAVQAMLRGELDVSERHLEQALRAAPERPILHKNLALVHQARGDLDKALAGLNRAISLKPSLSACYLHRGDVLQALGRRDEAVISYWQAWRGFPNAESLAADELVPPSLRGLLQRAGETLRDAQMELIEESMAPVLKRHGADALKNVQEAAEIYVGLKRAPYPHALQRPALIYLPGLAPRPFFERDEFAWYGALEAATHAIRAELQSARAGGEGFKPYVQVAAGTDPQQWTELNGSGKWNSLHLIKAGMRDEVQCARCPETVRALEALPLPRLPGHAPEVLFSLLEPGTHIPPHYGLGNYKLALHLPLIVPEGCSIRVGNETRSWKAGECLIFDDSFQHEAWNRGTEMRAVLIADIWHPQVSAAEQEGISALLEAIGAFNLKYQPAS